MKHFCILDNICPHFLSGYQILVCLRKSVCFFSQESISDTFSCIKTNQNRNNQERRASLATSLTLLHEQLLSEPKFTFLYAFSTTSAHSSTSCCESRGQKEKETCLLTCSRSLLELSFSWGDISFFPVEKRTRSAFFSFKKRSHKKSSFSDEDDMTASRQNASDSKESKKEK